MKWIAVVTLTYLSEEITQLENLTLCKNKEVREFQVYCIYFFTWFPFVFFRLLFEFQILEFRHRRDLGII
jgi:hypothetical protein